MLAIAIPGTRIGHVDEAVAGKGTFVRQGRIYASVVGKVVRRKISHEERASARANSDNNNNVEIDNGDKSSSSSSSEEIIEVIHEKEIPIVPVLGSLVTCRVREAGNSKRMRGGSGEKKAHKFKIRFLPSPGRENHP